MFEYSVGVDVTTAIDYDGKSSLVNSESGTCLLLRTSGTTARPKGVPLAQGNLITNGALIAHAMVRAYKNFIKMIRFVATVTLTLFHIYLSSSNLLSRTYATPSCLYSTSVVLVHLSFVLWSLEERCRVIPILLILRVWWRHWDYPTLNQLGTARCPQSTTRL